MSDRTALQTLLQPGGLTAVFQPIFDVSESTPRIYSFECLIRGPVGTHFESAKVLFDYVRFKREEIAADRACIATSLAAAREIPGNCRLSLNVHACTLGRDYRFPDFLLEQFARNGISSSRVCIEIVEHAPPWDDERFLAAIARLRELQISVALDDVGLGQSNFKMILDVRPDSMKIDRYFIHGLADDQNRQAVLESLVLLAQRFRSVLVVEGVERALDYEAVRRLGIHLVQGYFFSPPLTVVQLRELNTPGAMPCRPSPAAAS